MELELLINEKFKKINLIEQKDNLYKIQVDDKIYEVDAIKTSENVYSIIHENISHNLEIHKTDESGNNYSTNLRNIDYDIKVYDAQTKYQLNRNKDDNEEDSNIISTPMPGQIVKIFVKEGEELKKGDLVVVVEAMKMESEYKAHQDCVVKEILVKEGDNIDGNQPLVVLE